MEIEHIDIGEQNNLHEKTDISVYPSSETVNIIFIKGTFLYTESSLILQ